MTAIVAEPFAKFFLDMTNIIYIISGSKKTNKKRQTQNQNTDHLFLFTTTRKMFEPFDARAIVASDDDNEDLLTFKRNETIRVRTTQFVFLGKF